MLFCIYRLLNRKAEMKKKNPLLLEWLFAGIYETGTQVYGPQKCLTSNAYLLQQRNVTKLHTITHAAYYFMLCSVCYLSGEGGERQRNLGSV